MTIKVEQSHDPVRPITIWWTGHSWSALTIEEARDFMDALEALVFEVSWARLPHLQSEAIKGTGLKP